MKVLVSHNPTAAENRSQEQPNSVSNRLQRKLQLAMAYWLRTIRPYIEGRKLMGVELYVADHAHNILRTASTQVAEWNHTNEGRLAPVPTLPDFQTDDFRPPEPLFADESLKAETLALIAASLTSRAKAELSPPEAVQTAHELLFAAEQHLRTLPRRPSSGSAVAVDALRLAATKVTFDEILCSNRKGSGQLPLLPPMFIKKKGHTDDEIDCALKLPAIKTAALDFLNQQTPAITKEEYESGLKQEETLAGEGKLSRAGTETPMTYPEWQRHNQEQIEDCRKNKRISALHLCGLRWQRFKSAYESQKARARNRKDPAKPAAKPKGQTAPISPMTPGKRKR